VANPNSLRWRAPGRRDKEREAFAVLMRKVEAIRLRHGMTKKAVAAEIGTDKDVLRSWLVGEAMGRAESVAKIKDFLERKISLAILCSHEHNMNRHLFDLLRRIEDSSRRLASTITFNSDQPMREVSSVKVELDEIDNALDAFKREVVNGASVGTLPGRLSKKDGN
jgi:hypothetical protein